MMSTALITPCREWQGGRAGRADGAGYGVRYVRGRGRVRVHRWVWEQIYGPIPKGMVVMHRCDNPPCFRLDHLKLGTQAENMADKAAKGRGRAGRGSGRPKGPRPLAGHCRRGHLLDEANTYQRPANGQLLCRKCAALNARVTYANAKARR